MAIRKVPLVEGEYFHIYNRGNSKQEIFLDDEDRQRFLKLLYICNSTKRIDFRRDIVKKKIVAWEFDKGKPIIAIGAWVLMPNHFHLYITSLLSEALLPTGNAITDFMQRVLTSYSKYFNAKYQRTGSLFEGKFKSTHINRDPQAQYLFSYIHLNPLKLIDSKWKIEGIKDEKKALEFLNNYKWSSYQDYLMSTRPEGKIINRDKFLNYFSTTESFKKDIFSWIKKEELDGSLASV